RTASLGPCSSIQRDRVVRHRLRQRQDQAIRKTERVGKKRFKRFGLPSQALLVRIFLHSRTGSGREIRQMKIGRRVSLLLGFFSCGVLFALPPPASVTVPGLSTQVEILRDRWGVPHIYAQTLEDLFFAQGWITAKDRLFQIDLGRRVGTGKLAEVQGAKALG